jgi:rhamnogalacturonyl hydrolase YesR
MSTSMQLKAQIQSSLERVITWVQENEYRGYEPADGNSSWLFPLTRGKVFPMRVLQQVVLRAPFNIRPLIGISPHESAIGRGYMAWGYLMINRLNGDDNIRREAVACLEWLIANRASRYPEFCWGDPYEYATRGGRRQYGEPLLIWSALIGQVFLEAYEQFCDEKYLRVAESIGDWILKLPREDTETECCLSYNAYSQASIHNSNIMGAAFLSRVAVLTKNHEAKTVAKCAMAYTCSRQRRDGSWYYAEGPKFHWIDNFHTGYNLSAIKIYSSASKDDSFDDVLVKGRQFYKSRFFEGDGRPKYFHDSVYPIDIQCASQAIDTLTLLAEDDPECLLLAMKVARWTLNNMQGKDGHFFYRDLGWRKVRTPMLHWGQGTMVKALAALLKKLTPMCG